MNKLLYPFLFLAFWANDSKSQKAFSNEWKSRNFQPFSTYNDVALPITAADATITIDAGVTLDSIKPTIFGNNLASYMNKNSLTAALKKENWKHAGHTLMRWPGGNQSNQYFWDGNIPSSIKTDPKFPLSAAISGTDGAWRLTNDGYLQMLDTLNCQGIVCVNAAYAFYGTDADPVATAAHYAADYVRYMNGTKKANIKYWEVGNENYGPWQAGYLVNGVQTTGTQYGQVFNVFVDSMKAADPTIFVGAVIHPDEGAYSNWSNLVLPEVQDKADFLIIHEYFHPSTNRNAITEDQIYAELVQVANDKKQVQDMVAQYTNKPRDYFPIAMTEFNSRSGIRELSRTNAIFVSACLGEYAKNGYDAVTLWNMQNGYENPNDGKDGGDHGIISRNDAGADNILGNADDLPDGSAYPALYAYYYYSKYFGDQMLSSTVSNADLLIYPTTFTSGEIGLVLINKSANNHTAECTLQNKKLGNRIYWHTITGEGDMDRTVFINGNGPALGSAGVSGPQNYASLPPNSASVSGNSFKFDAPAYSVSYIALEAGVITGNNTPTNGRSPEVFPNPTSGRVILPAGGSFIVKNSEGKMIQEGTGNEVDLSDQPAGWYLIIQGNTSYRVIKE